MFLTSCGFKPMYGSEVDHDHNHALAEIKIEILNSKQSYKLRNYLEDELDPGNDRLEKLYDLSINVQDDITDLLVQQDSTITTKQHNITAHYVLKDIHNKKVIDQGDVKFAVSFDELQSEYATYAIGEKTYDNSLRELASTIKKRLIIALIKYKRTLNYENNPS
jgi:hypothetical protein